MAYTPHEMNAKILLDAGEARTLILDAYKKAKCSVRGAAVVLGCSERTLFRWIERLNLDGKLEAMKKVALKEGWHHDHSRHGGRPRGTKKPRKREARVSE